MKPAAILMLLLLGLPAHADVATAFEAFEARDYAAASERLKALTANGNTSGDVLFRLAASEFRRGNIKAAQSHLDAMTDAGLERLDALMLQGMVHMARLEEVSIFRKVGVAKSALTAWQSAAELDPEFAAAHYAVLSYYANAPGIAGGDRDKARGMLPTLEALDPMYAAVASGVLASKDKDFASAETAFRRATSIDDERAMPWFSLAQHYYQQEAYDDALAALDVYETREQSWQDPDAATITYFRGMALQKQGKHTEAKTVLNRSLQMDPGPRLKARIQEALATSR